MHNDVTEKWPFYDAIMHFQVSEDLTRTPDRSRKIQKRFAKKSDSLRGRISAARIKVPEVQGKSVSPANERSCAHCAHLADKIKAGIPLHNLLAYTRCRCHRPENYQTASKLPILSTPKKSDTLEKKAVLFEKQPSPQNCIKSGTLPRIDSSCQLESLSKSFVTTTSHCKLSSFHKSLQKSKGRLDPLSHDPLQLESLSHERLCAHEGSKGHLNPSTSNTLLQSQRSQKSLQGGWSSLQSSILLTKSKGKLSTKSKVLDLPKEAFSLSTLGKFVDKHKQKQLRDVFRSLDSDDDGNLTYQEVLKVICAFSLSKHFLHYIHQLYLLLSESTYFGKREFFVIYSVAERLGKSMSIFTLQSSAFQEISVEKIRNIIVPFLECIYNKSRSDGTLPLAQLKGMYLSARGKILTTPLHNEVISLFEVLAIAPMCLL